MSKKTASEAGQGTAFRPINQLALDAVLAAMCAALGYLSLDFGNLEITFASLPILIGALLFGPVDGLLIGGVGEFLHQVLRYGLDVTTPLWMVPYLLMGLLVGTFAKNHQYRWTPGQLTGTVFLMEFLVTLLNTGVLVIHSKLFGYYEPAFITGALALRILLTAAKGIAFSAVLPPVLKALKKALR